MKFIYYCVVICFFCILGCAKESIEENIPKTSLYLHERSIALAVNFADVSESTPEVTLDIIVRALGGSRNYDRSFKLVPLDSSTAQIGIDYILNNESILLKSGKLIDTTQIRILRNPQLPKDGTVLHLKLVAGSDFDTEFLDYKNMSTIRISNKVAEPLYWYYFAYNYLGDYSEKKFRLLQNLAEMPKEALDNLPDSDQEYALLIGKLKRWGLILKRHLAEQTALGKTVYEEDGRTKMQVGSYL